MKKKLEMQDGKVVTRKRGKVILVDPQILRWRAARKKAEALEKAKTDAIERKLYKPLFE